MARSPTWQAQLLALRAGSILARAPASGRELQVQDIADWLSSLGLSEYEERFAQNHTDGTVLRDLTEQDLKDLGVSSIGHRRKLMRAIAERTPAAPVDKPAGELCRPDYAERRQLTVMFCDLVGS